MGKRTMNIITFTVGALPAKALNNEAYGTDKGIQGNIQDYLEDLAVEQCWGGVLTGFGLTSSDANDKVVVASGVAHFLGCMIEDGGDISFVGQPTDTYHIYMTSAGTFGAQTGALDLTSQLPLGDVDWNLGTTSFSNLVDLRQMGIGMVEAPILIDGANATFEELLFVAQHYSYIHGIVIVCDAATVGSDGANNWTIDVINKTDADASIYSTPYDTDTDGELAANAAIRIFADQVQTLEPLDVLGLKFTKTGAPTDLSSARIWVAPLVIPVQP